MSEHGVSIAFRTDQSLSAYGLLAAEAKRLGFDGVSVYDLLIPAGLAAGISPSGRRSAPIRCGPSSCSVGTCYQRCAVEPGSLRRNRLVRGAILLGRSERSQHSGARLLGPRRSLAHRNVTT